jgi:hypothetical protein
MAAEASPPQTSISDDLSERDSPTGVDDHLLRELLALTPLERLQRAQAMVDAVMELRRARRVG